jgi:hypothetical protein
MLALIFLLYAAGLKTGKLWGNLDALICKYGYNSLLPDKSDRVFSGTKSSHKRTAWQNIQVTCRYAGRSGR